jgi:hypothetical protein
MSRREVASLACKILALWLFAQAAVQVAAVVIHVIHEIYWAAIGDAAYGWGEFSAVIYSAPAVIMFAVGLFFWRGARWLAGKMVADDPAPVTASSLTQDSVLSVALAAIGVWLLIAAVRGLASNLAVTAGTTQQSDWLSGIYLSEALWSYGLALAFALGLIFGSSGISRFILRARRAGLKTKARDESP